MLQLSQTTIKEIESTYENIYVNQRSSARFDNDEYVRYDVIYDGAELFQILVSKLNFRSGRVDQDYSIIADIEEDCFQTNSITKFTKVVTNYIKEIV